MIKNAMKSCAGLPGNAILFSVFCCVVLAPNIAHSAEYKNLKAPQSYVLETFQNHDLLLLGTIHRRPPILNFIKDLIPNLKGAGVTHVGLEIPTNQQGNINTYMNTGNGLMNINVHPQIDCPEYRNLLKTLHALDPGKRPSVVALDLPKNLYKKKTNRNEWMARTIADRIPGNPGTNTKFLVIVGNLHVLKKIEWQDHVQNKFGSIREYVTDMVPSLKVFTIGQAIDRIPTQCDFTKEFGPVRNAVALDIDCEMFKDWKIWVNSGIAIKKTEPCQLFDGVIVY